ncbi:phage replication protein [Actinobaculum suis]|uniref:Phage replication protein n=1 Tax=Actinobaculum suis TaxID=1657 RepID=A0A7Z8Y802_9ACTO|nr:TFIIB-type zinc ribbon-containing protein [Actinobaculum suis]VDG75652.1 phage replication protein [Actinobaculum suis]
MASTPRYIDSFSGRDHGLNKCPRCGSAEVKVDAGTFTCAYCKNAWTTRTVAEHSSTDVRELTGMHIGLGASDIDKHASDLVTVKCQGCGGEIVLHTDNTLQAQCHWCRQTLSINRQIPNGIVPDLILPFQVSRKDAIKSMKRHLRSGGIWVDGRFRRQFNKDAVRAVYLPYVVVDANATITLEGRGERQQGRGMEGSRRSYDVDSYQVGRKFNIAVDDLAVESSADYSVYSEGYHEKRPSRFNILATSFKTLAAAVGVGAKGAVNILNTLQPFDTENAVAFDANLMRGYTSERRTRDVDDLTDVVLWQVSTIGRQRIRPTLANYDRGVSWDKQHIDLVGSRWFAIYLPVWLYSARFASSKKEPELDYHVAVNGRTGKVNGSLPVSYRTLMAFSGGLTLLAFLLGLFLTYLGFFRMPGETKILGLAALLFTLAAPLLTMLTSITWVYRRTVKLEDTHPFEDEANAQLWDVTHLDEFDYNDPDVWESKIKDRNDHQPRMRIEGTTITRHTPT